MNELTAIKHVPIVNDVEALTDLQASDLINKLEHCMEPHCVASPSMMHSSPVGWILSVGMNVEGKNLATWLWPLKQGWCPNCGFWDITWRPCGWPIHIGVYYRTHRFSWIWWISWVVWTWAERVQSWQGWSQPSGVCELGIEVQGQSMSAKLMSIRKFFRNKISLDFNALFMVQSHWVVVNVFTKMPCKI